MTDVPQIHLQIRGALGIMTEEDLAATLLLNSTDTLATWRHQKKGPAYVKLGKRVFYTVDGLRQWVQQKSNEQNMPSELLEPAQAKAAA